MTKSEFNELFDLLSYGHDADIKIGNQRVFFEWQDGCLAVYHIVDEKGKLLKKISGSDKISVVSALFNISLFGKNLNDNYNEIDILDVE